MSAAGGTALRVELARETAAADLARFVRALGLTANRQGTTVEIAETLALLAFDRRDPAA